MVFDDAAKTVTAPMDRIKLIMQATSLLNRSIDDGNFDQTVYSRLP